MSQHHNQTDPLSGGTAVLQCADGREMEREREAVEPLEEQLLRARDEYRRRVDRRIQLAAETPIVLRPGLRESDAHDFFISYAREDKNILVHKLVRELRQRGAKVWYHECVFRVGDSPRRQIDEGLANSLFGIALLSPVFFSKEWPQEELENLLLPDTRDSDKRIFPLWHCVPKDQVLRQGPPMLDCVSFTTSEYTPEEFAAKMLQVKELHAAKRATGASP